MRQATRTESRAWPGLAVLAAVCLWTGMAAAQLAEAPPPGAGNSYTDSVGCVWQRVEIGDQVAWAALIGADGAQVCASPTADAADVSGPTPALTADGGTDSDVAARDTTADPAGTASLTPTGQGTDRDTAEAGALIPQAAAQPVREAGWRKSRKMPVFPDPGHYLQVGAFAEVPNADRTVALLQGQGFGVLKQDFPHRRGMLRVLYAGPFAERAEADVARRFARRNGYPDAFIWTQK